jgi:hypothetical protein
VNNKRSQRIPPSNLLKGDQLSLLGDKESCFDWELENGPACQHLWQKSLNKLGCPQWRCYGCRETKPSDPDEDRAWWEASMLQVRLQGDEYYRRALESQTKVDRDKYLECTVDCRERHALMTALLNNPGDRLDLEENLNAIALEGENPLATNEKPSGNMGDRQTSDNSIPSPNPVSVLGDINNPIEGTLTQISPSNKSRRKNGEGTGSIFSTKVTRRSKTYLQYWFQYEEKLTGGKRKRKSVYIPVKKVARIKQLQLDREPVDVILEQLGHTRQ